MRQSVSGSVVRPAVDLDEVGKAAPRAGDDEDVGLCGGGSSLAVYPTYHSCFVVFSIGIKGGDSFGKKALFVCHSLQFVARINLCLLDKVVNYVNFANGADHVKRRQLLKQPFGDKVSISGGKVDRHIVIFQILWGIWPRPATRGIWPFWFPSH